MKPNLLVAAPHYGKVSEVWMRRQIQHLGAFNIHILTWSLEGNAETNENITVLEEFDWNSHAGQRRWLRRAQNSLGLNFYGVRGNEKRAISNIVSSLRPDVVLAHFGPTALKILPITKRLGVPLVTHYHGYDLSSGLRSPWYRWSLRFQRSAFYASVVVGEFQRSVLTALGHREETIHCIPCGVPFSYFQATTDGNKEKQLAPRFIYVGRLVRQKGIDISLRAFRRVLEKHPTCELTIIGEGPEETAIKDLVHDLDLNPSVRLTGALKQDEVLRELKRSDVYIQHSIPGADGSIEGFGVAITEASACGLPVVSTSTGGIPDQIMHGENGFLVSPHDEMGMAERMLELANNPEKRRKMGEAARERARLYFDTADLTARLERVLLDAIRGSHG